MEKQFPFRFRFAGAPLPLPKLLRLPSRHRGLLSDGRQVLPAPQALTKAAASSISMVSESNAIILLVQTRRIILSERHPKDRINSTVPASISTKRRSISADHAASTSGSDIVSDIVLDSFMKSLRASLSSRIARFAVFDRNWATFTGKREGRSSRCSRCRYGLTRSSEWLPHS